jgi:hypothetical protein
MFNIEQDGLYRFIPDIEREKIEILVGDAFDELYELVTESWYSLHDLASVLRYLFRGHR